MEKNAKKNPKKRRSYRGKDTKIDPKPNQKKKPSHPFWSFEGINNRGMSSWEDVCGYVWGPQSQSISVPILNEKMRQTDYGAIDCQTRTFQGRTYPAGDSHSTIQFIEYLPNLYPDSQLMLIWDGASYHHSIPVKQYLAKLNKGGRRISDWQVRCLKGAPDAPEQNPVEDIWLQGNHFWRRHFYLNKTVAHVKKCFFDFLANKIFDLNKIAIYY